MKKEGARLCRAKCFLYLLRHLKSKASQRKRDARSGERRPAVAICIEHDMSSQCWVKTQDGSIISLDWENIHRN